MFFAFSCNQAKSEKNEPLCTKNLNIFTLRSVNDLLDLWDEPEFVDRGFFISLSDIDQLSNHPDSLAVPEFVSRIDWRGRRFSELSEEELRIFSDEMFGERRFFRLDTEYRRRFLARTNISETDSVFVYCYADDILLLAFPVKKLNVSAIARRFPHHNQDDYSIGFEIHTDNLLDLRGVNLFDKVFVYVGKTHPFARGGMEVIQWRRIPSENFPLEKSNLVTNDETVLYFMENGTRSERAFLYSTENFRIFLQDISLASDRWARARHLLIIDERTEDVVLERVIYSSRYGFITPLNFGIEYTLRVHTDIRNQWIGNLFRNSPPVILGFWEVPRGMLSTSCPFIMFLDPTIDDIFIRCDNRCW
jgi:hypothetical protein